MKEESKEDETTEPKTARGGGDETMNRFAGKVAIVTGGGTGIGLERAA
jgi:hypothetical protein